MTDFLKSNPHVTKEAYMWEWTIPQILLSSYDYTHVVYLSERETEKKNVTVINSAEDLMNDLGFPIFKDKK